MAKACRQSMSGPVVIGNADKPEPDPIYPEDWAILAVLLASVVLAVAALYFG